MSARLENIFPVVVAETRVAALNCAQFLLNIDERLDVLL